MARRMANAELFYADKFALLYLQVKAMVWKQIKLKMYTLTE